jgi:predicted enzyme related to lactoylglutathione lyase
MADRQQVTGIGGVFFRARDPEALAAWYQEQLGVPTQGTYAVFTDNRATVWAVHAENTDYWPAAKQGMINFTVSDLDAMLAQLRAAGAEVDDHVDDNELGRFGWAFDPEGNRFELWQSAEGLSPPT